ncbi:MAG: hypothetical protein LBT40_01775 [Deltaproteobacteria bacterium]|nr:hypothetical protein [Deltaproteobacteria bacterium]
MQKRVAINALDDFGRNTFPEGHLAAAPPPSVGWHGAPGARHGHPAGGRRSEASPGPGLPGEDERAVITNDPPDGPQAPDFISRRRGQPPDLAESSLDEVN